jgi:hypothetical protein
MLAQAGVVDVIVCDVPDDPCDSAYLAYKAA